MAAGTKIGGERMMMTTSKQERFVYAHLSGTTIIIRVCSATNTSQMKTLVIPAAARTVGEVGVLNEEYRDDCNEDMIMGISSFFSRASCWAFIVERTLPPFLFLDRGGSTGTGIPRCLLYRCLFVGSAPDRVLRFPGLSTSGVIIAEVFGAKPPRLLHGPVQRGDADMERVPGHIVRPWR